MSLNSFLSKIWEGIKEAFGAMPAELKVAVSIGVIVAENIKNFVSSPAADIITALIPGSLDDQIKNLLRAAMPKILADLLLINSTITLTDPDEITAASIKVLQSLDPKISSAFLHSISILVAQAAADGKLSWSDGVYVLQYYYKNAFEPAA